MQSTMSRRIVLGSLSLTFLAALGGELAARSNGASPPANPAIVFTEKTSKNMLLRVMNADGSNVQTVVTGGKWDAIREPSWSPDGSRLAFVGVLGGAQGLWHADRVLHVHGNGERGMVTRGHSGRAGQDRIQRL
jgi:Tol biopolymer transport system component